jgi:alpha-tubulin suppressor-like RCC1 family protein
MTINTAQLEQQLIKKISTTTDSLELLILAKAIKQLKIGQVITVGSYENLPNIYETYDGVLYFVETDRTLYIPNKSVYAWKPLINNSTNTLWSWGGNSSGVNGDNSITVKSSPVSVVGNFGDWCAISVSNNHALALQRNGTLWAWGEAGQGQLGNNSVVDRSSPIQLTSEYTWCQVSAAVSSSLAIRCDGTIWAWGSTLLANNCTLANSTSSPTSIVGGFSNWCSVSSHSVAAAAIRTDKTIWTWGQAGILGDGTNTVRYSPVSVVGGFTNWEAVSVGSSHMIALRSDGTVWAWGCNGGGGLGDNSAIDRSSPVSVVGGYTDWCAISAGVNTGAAIRTNGTLWTWGCARCGVLADNTTVNKSSPVSVVGGFTDWCKVDIRGNCFGMALRTNGTLWAWGLSTTGQLGANCLTLRSSPVSVVGGFNDWSIISTHGDESAAIRITTT